MFKNKELTIKDYFVNKKQFNRYENDLLDNNEVIRLSNKKTGKLSIDISKCNGADIIIENSDISNLQISGYYHKSMTNIIIRNCSIKKCNIDLYDKTRVHIYNSFLDNAIIIAEHIHFNDIDSKNIMSGKGYTKIFVGDECTKSISISNTKRELYSPIVLNVVTKILNISNCSGIYLSSKQINNLNIDHSKIYSNDVMVYTTSNIVNSNIQYCIPKIIDTKTLGYFASAIINFSGNCNINNCIVETNYIDVDKNSKLTTNNAYIHSVTGIALRDNSKIISNDPTEETIDTKVVYFYPNAHFNANNIDEINTSNITDRICPKYIKEERQKLTKVLKLVNDKYNYSIKKLKKYK